MSVEVIKAQNLELTGIGNPYNNTADNLQRVYLAIHHSRDITLAELGLTLEQIVDVLKLDHSLTGNGFIEPLYIQAIDSGKGNIAEELLTALAEIETVDMNSTDTVGQNLMHFVLRSHNLSIDAKAKLTNRLLEFGISPFQQDKLGISPLLLLLNRENEELRGCRESILSTLEHNTPETFNHLMIDGVHLLNYMALHAQEYSPEAMALICRHGGASHIRNVNEVKFAHDLAGKCSPEEFVAYRLIIYHAILANESLNRSEIAGDVNYSGYQTVSRLGNIETEPPTHTYKPKLNRSMSIEDFEHAILKANRVTFGHKLVRAFKAIPDKLVDKSIQYRARQLSGYQPREDKLGLMRYRAVNPVDRINPVDIENRQHGFVPVLLERQFQVERSVSDVEEGEIDQITEECSAPAAELEARRENLDAQIARTSSKVPYCLEDDNNEACFRRQQAKDNYKLVRTQSRLSKKNAYDSQTSIPLCVKRQAQRNSISSQLSHSLPKASFMFSPESSLNSLPAASPSSSYLRELSIEDEVFESPIKKPRTRRISIQPNVAMILERGSSEAQEEAFDVEVPVMRCDSGNAMLSQHESDEQVVVRRREPSTGEWEEVTISKGLMVIGDSFIAPALGQQVKVEATKQKLRNHSTGAFEEKTAANGLLDNTTSSAISVASSSKCCQQISVN